jgi:hypothetical protein
MAKPERESSLVGSIALIVIGLLIFIPSGLCTGVGVISSLMEAMSHPNGAAGAFGFLPVALIFGLPFVFGGGAMIYHGVSRIRARNRLSDQEGKRGE